MSMVNSYGVTRIDGGGPAIVIGDNSCVNRAHSGRFDQADRVGGTTA